MGSALGDDYKIRGFVVSCFLKWPQTAMSEHRFESMSTMYEAQKKKYCLN